MKPDGSLTGYVGGYRPWEPVYKGWVNARGPVIESLTWVQLPGSLLRLATQCRLQSGRTGRREDPHLVRAPDRCSASVCDDAGCIEGGGFC